MSHQDYNQHQQPQPILQQQHDTSHSQQDYSLRTHILLAHSWLLVLIVAPLTVALLIWVLVLLVRRQRRRRRQDEKRAQILHKSLALVSEGQRTEYNIIPPDTSHPKDQSKYGNKCNKTSKQSNNATDQLLLDLTTSSSSTSTNTSTSSAASTVQAGQLNPNDQDHNHHHHHHQHVHHPGRDETHLQNTHNAELAQACQLSAWHRSFSAYRALIDHTNCYLITLTSQEILACLVAFALAILNIIRTRNLFSCNLIIFILIATKLLSLLSLATFTFAKLVRLLRLRAPPVTCATATTTTTTSSSHHNDHRKPCQDCRKLQFPAVIQPVGSRAASRGQLKLDIIDCISEESSLDPLQSLNPDVGQHPDRSPRGAAGASSEQQQLTDEQQATISRLLVGHSSLRAKNTARQMTGTSSKLSSSLHPAGDFDSSPSNQLLMSALRALEGKNADLTKPAKISKDKPPAKKSRANSIVLALLSSSLALFCLYMRLVGVPTTDHQPNHQQHLNHLHLMTALNRNLTDWAISISTYPTTTLSATGGGGGTRTSTTTEASTRYESTSGDGLDGTSSSTTGSSNSSDAVHLVPASLSSIQQTTSQLRHLIDAHELHTFAQLLLDTQLQTSRFSCNLSSGNYAPLARSTMLTIYLCLLAIVALIGTLIQQVGRRKMKQFLLASQMQLMPETSTGGCVGQQQHHHRSLFQALPSQLLSRHHQHHNQSNSNQATDTNQIINQSMDRNSLNQQRKLSGGSSGGAPLSLFGRQNSQRYSDLLKQNLRHHQSLAELTTSCGGQSSSSLLAKQLQHKQRRRLLMREQRQQHKLARNSSSMSSLLFGLTSSSSGGTADNRASRKLTATKRHLLAAGRPVEGEDRHRCHQMRRLAVSQPSNLNALGRQQTTTAHPAQKLAWLPQGSGAGVAASLYQIGANANQRVAPPSNPPNELFELSNLISKGSGGGGCLGANHFPLINGDQTQGSPASNKKNCKNQGQENACVAMRTGLPRAHQARSKIGITSAPTSTSSASQEHQELKQDLSLTKSIILFAQLLNHGPVLLLLAIGTFLPDGIVGGSGQQQQQQPVDSLQEQQQPTEAATGGGGGGSWTGVHDNAFAWLMLVEALAWPLLLCASDTQIAHALRRSLRASSCTPPAVAATAAIAQCSPAAPSSAGHATTGHNQTSRLSLANGATGESAAAAGDFKHKQWPLQFAATGQQQRLNQSSAGGGGGNGRLLRNHSHNQINLAGSRLDLGSGSGNGHRAAGGNDDHARQYHNHLAPRGANFANPTNNYLLGPSSTYPNFMFAFGGVSGGGGKQPRHLGRATFAASASGTEIYSQPPANGQRVALAGELGLLTTAVNDYFAAKGGIRELSPSPYDHLDAPAASATCWPPVMGGDCQNLAKNDSDPPKARKTTTSNLLISVGRRLFNLGRRRDRHRRARRRMSSGANTRGPFGTGTSANTDVADDSGLRGCDHQPASKRIRRSSELSPTSSLSTLIRKFNHDNYTSVCRQYENHNIIMANENNKRLLDMSSEQVADGAPKSAAGTDHEIISLGGDTTTGLLSVERICARKGGLAYEFSLNDDRINPMLATTTNNATSIGSGTRKQKDSSESVVKQQVVASNGQHQLSSKLMAASDKMARLLELDVAATSSERNRQNSASETRQSASMAQNIQQQQVAPPSLANGRADTNRNQKPLVALVSGSANDKVAPADRPEQTSAPQAKQTENDEEEHERGRRPPSGGGSKPQEPLAGANLPQVATDNYKNSSSAVATKPQQPQQESKQTSAAAPAAAKSQANNNYLNQMQLRLQQFEDNEPAAAADAVTCVDYATLRSLDDALSLVSVSSEFEYHDIGQLGAPFAQTSSTGVCQRVVESTPAVKMESRSREQQQGPPIEGATSSSGSNSNQRPTVANKQADDLRFPSFLATTPQAPAAAAAQSHAHSTSSSSQVPNRRQSTSHSNLIAPGSGGRRRADFAGAESGRSKQAATARAAQQQQQAKISSSLLELTAAKYASGSGGGAPKHATNGQVGTNSSTITKSRAAQKSSPSLVQFGEFNRHRSGSSVALGVFAGGASRNAHENGNVRARIMRMEQQQHQQIQEQKQQQQRRIQMTGRHHQQVSSPNLTALQLDSGSKRVDHSHQQSSSSSTSTASTTASMIPVLASSAGRHHHPAR